MESFLVGSKIGRNKIQSIINIGLFKWIFKKIVRKLKQKKFTLLVDETTGKSGERLLAIGVRFSENFLPRTYLLSLVEIEGSANGENLFRIINKILFQNDHAIISNLVCFTSDGASVMKGGKRKLQGQGKSLLAKLNRNKTTEILSVHCYAH